MRVKITPSVSFPSITGDDSNPRAEFSVYRGRSRNTLITLNMARYEIRDVHDGMSVYMVGRVCCIMSEFPIRYPSHAANGSDRILPFHSDPSALHE